MSKTFRTDPFTRDTVPEKDNKPYKLSKVKRIKVRNNVKYHTKRQTQEVDEQTNS